jgi:hypothetical protein
MKTGTPTTGMVCAKPTTTSAANVDVQVTFPTVAGTDFTVSATGANWTTVGAWPGIATATPTVSGKTVTWTYTAPQTLSAGTTYCFHWTNSAALKTGAAGNNQFGSIRTRTTAGAVIDRANYALSVISDDRIVITATIPPLFTFILSGNTDSFTTNLSSTAVVSTTGQTAEVRTNASNGWTTWVKSANTGLNSASTGEAIATAGSIDAAPSDLDPTLGYVLDVDATTQGAAGDGTMSIAAEYDGTTIEEGGTLSTVFQPIAAGDGTTDGDIMTLIERAFISSVQAAATDYTDTLTVVAAGLF